MLILGIETSCDETSASIVRRNTNGSGEILSNIIRSQIEEHAPYGGVVPEVIVKALNEADVQLERVDGIATTAGPGLVGGLIVGVMTGKAIAAALDKPFISINHLEGHALTARLTDRLGFPFLLLLVSGGHTQILLVKSVGEYERWASTIDDALGEAFDKSAKLLGLPYRRQTARLLVLRFENSGTTNGPGACATRRPRHPRHGGLVPGSSG
jgi:N6-L-threonylcarbamoyladenine synthase